MRYKFDLVDSDENITKIEYEGTSKLDRKHFSGKLIKTMVSDLQVGDVIILALKEFTIMFKEQA